MKTKHQMLAAVLTVLNLISCSSATKNKVSSEFSNQVKADAASEEEMAASSNAAGSASWSAKMSELRITLKDFGPYLFSDAKFYDPKSLPEIKSYTKKLYDLAHTLEQKGDKKSVMAPSSDPVLKYFMSQFKENLGRAYESLDVNHKEYARQVLKTSVSYCISCHTRSDAGPKFPLFDNPSYVSDLQPTEQATYFTATRQYDAALDKYLSILEDPNTGVNRPFDIEKSARSAMAIAIRVKQNLEEAQKVILRVSKKQDVPLYIKAESAIWEQSIQEWKKEKKSQPVSEAEFINKIQGLLKKARQVQRYPGDASGDVFNLRATSLIHAYFDTFPKPSRSAEVLYLAGEAYEPLNDLGFWTLHEMYYEECIRAAPNTAISRKCYQNLEQSVVLGYSGSAGTFLPLSVKQHLIKLRELASPKK